jgi:hypothetical protein
MTPKFIRVAGQVYHLATPMGWPPDSPLEPPKNTEDPAQVHPVDYVRSLVMGPSVDELRAKQQKELDDKLARKQKQRELKFKVWLDDPHNKEWYDSTQHLREVDAAVATPKFIRVAGQVYRRVAEQEHPTMESLRRKYQNGIDAVRAKKEAEKDENVLRARLIKDAQDDVAVWQHNIDASLSAPGGSEVADNFDLDQAKSMLQQALETLEHAKNAGIVSWDTMWLYMYNIIDETEYQTLTGRDIDSPKEHANYLRYYHQLNP